MIPADAVLSRAGLVVDIGGVPMSARLAQVAEPRATVLALHGGATTARYFDHPTDQRLSLLHAGQALGFTVLAIDRPGYGASAGHDAAMASPAQRAELVWATVDALVPAAERGAGLFVMAHSLGTELALTMAGGPRGTELLGVEIAGTGRRHHPDAEAVLGSWSTGPAGTEPPRTRGIRDLIWWQPGTYPPDIVGNAAINARTPRYEGEVARGWMEHGLPRLASGVRVPVRFALGEHERVWAAGPAALADVAALFTGSPAVTVAEQRGSGHNLSLSRAALAYHLGVLAFVEECVLERRAR